MMERSRYEYKMEELLGLLKLKMGQIHTNMVGSIPGIIQFWFRGMGKGAPKGRGSKPIIGSKRKFGMLSGVNYTLLRGKLAYQNYFT